MYYFPVRYPAELSLPELKTPQRYLRKPRADVNMTGLSVNYDSPICPNIDILHSTELTSQLPCVSRLESRGTPSPMEVNVNTSLFDDRAVMVII